MNQPVKKFRAGQVSAAIWENQTTVNGRQVTMLKTTIERRYKDKDGNWKSSNSFGRNEIQLARHVLQQAFEAILDEEQGDDSTEETQVQ